MFKQLSVNLILNTLLFIFKHYTYGLAKSKGNAVSCILDGALYPISYTPLSKFGCLKKM